MQKIMNDPEPLQTDRYPDVQVTDTQALAPPADAAGRVAVSVVMCTYQGSRHVEEQLRSVLQQSWPVRLLVSDDASVDNTVELAAGLLRDDVDRLEAQDSNVGYVKNFERAMASALEGGTRYLALADQDDIWTPDRIAHGMQAMQELERVHGPDVPLLVHSDLTLIDEQGSPLHDSYLTFRRYRLGSEKKLPIVLGENGVMGNTVLMNRALATLALPFPDGLHVHDYWLALLAELFGQRSLLTEPQVSYRLHQSNASNTASSLLTGWRGLFDRSHVRRWLALDFKLPFKEDSRQRVVEHVLSTAHRYPSLGADERAELQAFLRYLAFEQPRHRSLGYLLRSGATRRGFRFRLRLCLAVMLTRRYR